MNSFLKLLSLKKNEKSPKNLIPSVFRYINDKTAFAVVIPIITNKTPPKPIILNPNNKTAMK